MSVFHFVVNAYSILTIPFLSLVMLAYVAPTKLMKKRQWLRIIKVAAVSIIVDSLIEFRLQTKPYLRLMGYTNVVLFVVYTAFVLVSTHAHWYLSAWSFVFAIGVIAMQEIETSFYPKGRVVAVANELVSH